MKRADLIGAFRNSFPKVDQTSMSGMILFQGFCTGIKVGTQKNANVIALLKEDVRSKDASLDILTNHITSLNQYLSAEKKHSIEAIEAIEESKDFSNENYVDKYLKDLKAKNENSEGELHV